MPVSYDRAVLDKAVQETYDRAAGAIVGYSILGTLLGLVAGGFVVAFMGSRSPGAALATAAILAGLGLAIGHAIGSRVAFRLRYEAQRVLVHVEIEHHLAALASREH